MCRTASSSRFAGLGERTEVERHRKCSADWNTSSQRTLFVPGLYDARVVLSTYWIIQHLPYFALYSCVVCEVWHNLLSFIINGAGREVRRYHVFNQRIKRGKKSKWLINHILTQEPQGEEAVQMMPPENAKPITKKISARQCSGRPWSGLLIGHELGEVQAKLENVWVIKYTLAYSFINFRSRSKNVVQ